MAPEKTCRSAIGRRLSARRELDVRRLQQVFRSLERRVLRWLGLGSCCKLSQLDVLALLHGSECGFLNPFGVK